MSIAPELHHFTRDFAAEAATFLHQEIAQAVSAHSICRLALAGGNTPRGIHAQLVKIGADLPWHHVQVTFGDERCVPPDHVDSNYRMARESLLEHVPIPAGNVFRVEGEADPDTAARHYESRLAAVAARFGEPRYVHELLILGVGEDGHTASLFPGSAALAETARNVIPAIGPKPPPQRITMTLPLLNAARHVCFLVSGKDKRAVVEEILAGDQRYPAARVRAARTSWLLGW